MFEMATSMALGGLDSPHMGGGLSSNGSMGSLTPSHHGIKFCASGRGSGTSSIHSPISSPSSTPNSTITINGGSDSIGKCPGSVNSSGGGIGNNNSSGNIANNNNNSGSDLFGSKCKRKINFSNLGIPGRSHQPATVARRNARERNRVKQVNNGFAALKQHIPLGHRSKKMSKVETLRCAVDYIRNLQGLLNIKGSFSLTSPGGSSVSTNSEDILISDDDENEEQPLLAHQQSHPQQQQQMNGVNNQRDAFALSSSSSSPTSDFGAVVPHLSHHLAALHSHHQHHPHHQQQHLSSNHLRHLSLSHHHLHGPNSVSVAAALLAESNSNGMTVTPNANQLSPTSSEDPSSPSYASEASYVNSNQTIKGKGLYDYENYEPVSPEDEELLDAIAWWQQS